MTNSVFDNLGVPDPGYDPLSITGPANLHTQGALSGRMQEVVEIRSTNYETFPLYGEAFILSVLQELYVNDPLFTYIPDDDLKSRIMFATSYPRDAATRDRRPAIVVAFQQSASTSEILRDTFQGGTASDPINEKRGIMDRSVFKVSILHSNRAICLFLAQQCRGEITMNMQLMREVFKLHQISPPGLSGPGLVKDYTDLFICTMQVECSYFPRWTQREKPEYIRRIILSIETTARQIMQDAVIDAKG